MTSILRRLKRPHGSIAAAAAVVLALIVSACDSSPSGDKPLDGNASVYRLVSGDTMGTYYRIQYRASESCDIAQSATDALLAQFNQSLSTYIPDSEISEFNRAEADRWVTVSPRLLVVVQTALEVWRQTEGSFDITIGPLVNLWGFGPEEMPALPSVSQQREAARWVGMRQLQIDGINAKLLKTGDGVYIDMSALAKGLGVDELAEYLAQQDCGDYLVDIGGEMRVAGVNAKGGPWRVGIERPVPGRQASVQRVLTLTDIAVATSGDYRNFRQVDGVRVDHVIDPRSGRPADNQVASVTVLHPQAMYADAYATAIMVLGTEAGLALAGQLQLPVLIVEKSADGDFVERYTDAITNYMPGLRE